jgi:regulator of ribonuclease activity B
MERSKHYERNIATLRALKNAGSNPDKVHSIEHHLYCHSDSEFQKAVALGQRRGFTVAHAGKHDDEELWSLDLVKRSLPSIEFIEEQAIEVEAIAAATEADYDGWGTEVEQ